jgi:hypothetical protein
MRLIEHPFRRSVAGMIKLTTASIVAILVLGGSQYRCQPGVCFND